MTNQDIANPRELVEQFFSAFNNREPDQLDQLCTEDLIIHAELNETVHGRETYKEALAAAWPILDVKCLIEDMVAEGNKVAVRLTNTGTHQGELFGIPPTGKTTRVPMFCFMHIKGGRIAEAWFLIDLLMWLQQVGAKEVPQ